MEALFSCDKCGICCKNLDKNKIYTELDRGDGICKNLDVNKNLCNIYNDRPLICNVTKAYKKLFLNALSYEKYLELNKKSCEKLKRKEDEKGRQ